MARSSHNLTLFVKFKQNHSQALDELDNDGIICMNYNLEMDLLCSDRAVEVMANILNLRREESNRYFILTKKSKAAKKLDTMLKTLRELNNRNLPNSYKRIKKKLVDISKHC